MCRADCYLHLEIAKFNHSGTTYLKFCCSLDNEINTSHTSETRSYLYKKEYIFKLLLLRKIKSIFFISHCHETMYTVSI